MTLVDAEDNPVRILALDAREVQQVQASGAWTLDNHRTSHGSLRFSFCKEESSSQNRNWKTGFSN